MGLGGISPLFQRVYVTEQVIEAILDLRKVSSAITTSTRYHFELT